MVLGMSLRIEYTVAERERFGSVQCGVEGMFHKGKGPVATGQSAECGAEMLDRRL